MAIRTGDIENALQAVLPGQGAAVAQLAVLLADMANGLITGDVAKARIQADTTLATLLDSLAGRHIQGRQALLSFGPDGRFGDIAIRDVAGGNIVNVTFNVISTTSPSIADLAAAEALLDTLPIETVAEVRSLSVPHRMPLRRNELFVGRAVDLIALARVLKEKRATAVITTGIGGIGKTQLASEFVHRYGQFFAGGVFWLSFSDPAGIDSEIAACGGVGGLQLYTFADKLTQDERVQRVYAAWESPLPRLLVFDNCDDLSGSSAEAQLLERLPHGGGCRVLITSRRGHWSRNLGVAVLPLGVLSRAESIALLRNYRADLDDTDAAAVAEELGDLPLALSLAGSYLAAYYDESFGAPSAYLAQLRRLRLRHQSMLGKGAAVSLTSHELNVWATFDLSFARLDTRNRIDSTATALLARAACMAPAEPFPRNVLTASLVIDDDDDDVDTLELLADALNRLIELGMLERTETDALRIHRLVTVFAREVIPDDGALVAVEDTIIDIGDSCWGSSERYRRRFHLLAAHLRYLANNAIGRLDDRASKLWFHLGNYLQATYTHNMLQNTGEMQEFRDEREAALASYVQALDLFRAIGDRLGEANVLQAMGDVQRLRDDLRDALASYAEALALYRALNDRPSTANVLKSIGDVQQLCDDREAALASYAQALALYRAVGGRLGEASVLQAIGDLQQFQRDLPAALASYAQAIDLFRAMGNRLGEADVLKSIGDAQQFRKELPAALASYAQALDLYRRVGNRLGEANVLKSIGDIQQFRQEAPAALASYKQALGLYRAVGAKLGEANVLQAIGDVQIAHDDREAALASYTQALRLYRTVGAKLGEANVLQAIGDVQVGHDDREAALASYTQALELFRLVGDHLGEANILASQGKLALMIDEQQQAATLLDHAIALYESLGSQYSVAAQIGNYGWTLRRIGRHEAARPYLRRAAALFGQMGLSDYAERHERAADKQLPPPNSQYSAVLPSSPSET